MGVDTVCGMIDMALYMLNSATLKIKNEMFLMQVYHYSFERDILDFRHCVFVK